MSRTPSPRRLALITTLALAVCGMLAPLAHASGTYRQILCADPATGQTFGTSALDGLTVAGTAPDWRPQLTGNVCSGTMDAGHAIAFSSRTGVSYAQGAWAALHYAVTKPHLSIDSAQIYRSVQGAGDYDDRITVGQHTGTDLADPMSGPNPWDWPMYGSSSYNRGDSAHPFSSANRLAVTAANNQFTISAACAGDPTTHTCAPAAGAWNYLFYGGTVTLHDDSDPVISSVSGTMTNTGHVGNTLRVSATDAGSGLYRYAVSVDNVQVKSAALDPTDTFCADAIPGNDDDFEFTSQVPCPSSGTYNLTWDPSTVSEGRHDLLVSVEDASGHEVAAFDHSVTVDQVANPAALAGATPQISGTLREGEVLSAAPGGWANASGYAYQWQQCSADGARCLDVAGATASAYRAIGDDVGRRLRVAVTATNPAGETAGAQSPTTDLVVSASAASGGTPPATGSAGQGASTAATTASGGTNPDPTPPAHAAVKNARITIGLGAHGRPTVRLTYGTRAQVSGLLVDQDGQPVADAPVQLSERPHAPGAAARAIGQVTTDAHGRFQGLAPPGSSRSITASYSATPGDAKPITSASATVRVTAHLALHARAARPGRVTRLWGTLAHAHAGVQLEMQALDGRRWRTFDTTVTRSGGRFAYGYRFKPTAAGRTFYLRVLVRSPLYPFEPGSSRKARIRVPR